MHLTYTFRRALINGVGLAFVSGLSLFLLIYVGHGEAKRPYQEFQVEKLVAQGQIIQKTMDTFLRGGHSVRQFVGFSTKVGPILASDPTIAAMSVFDQMGQPVFSSGESSIAFLVGLLSSILGRVVSRQSSRALSGNGRMCVGAHQQRLDDDRRTAAVLYRKPLIHSGG